MADGNFSYYDDWRSAVLTCPQCGWTGTFEQGAVEHYSELFDCSCPSCPYGPDRPILAIVSYPTIAESEQNWEKLSDSERKQVTAIKASQAKFEAQRLKGADELPEIEEPRIQIQWDQDSEGGNILLRWRGQVLWTEPARWECVDRYAQVVDILKEKYGDRLYDVEPSPRSELYLFGDQYSARGKVDQIRAGLRKSRP
jgi:hypothetical protein